MSDTGDTAAKSDPQWDFFISYTAVDRNWAEWIAWQLEDAGYRVMVQAWDFVPGSNWAVRMQEGVLGARRTIALLSEAYLRSVYGQAQWQAARAADPLGFERKLVPIRLEDCTRPGLLGTIVSIDLFGYSANAARHRLLNGIGAADDGRAKPATAPGFPSPPQPAYPGPVSTPLPAARRRLLPGAVVLLLVLAVTGAILADRAGQERNPNESSSGPTAGQSTPTVAVPANLVGRWGGVLTDSGVSDLDFVTGLEIRTDGSYRWASTPQCVEFTGVIKKVFGDQVTMQDTSSPGHCTLSTRNYRWRRTAEGTLYLTDLDQPTEPAITWPPTA
jgi:hypothetical protein